MNELDTTTGQHLGRARRTTGRGLLAGLAVGVLAFLFAFLVVEPQIDAAIADEEGRGATTTGSVPAPRSTC